MKTISNPKLRPVLLLLICVLFLLTEVSMSMAANLETTTVVPVGKWKLGRIRNVPLNSLLNIGIQTDDEIMAFLLSERQMKVFPKVKDAFLIAKVYKQFTAKTILRNEGNYYLLLFNKNGLTPVTVKFAVQVQPIRSLESNTGKIH